MPGSLLVPGNHLLSEVKIFLPSSTASPNQASTASGAPDSDFSRTSHLRCAELSRKPKVDVPGRGIGSTCRLRLLGGNLQKGTI
jgi:hypothetical protein